MMFSMFFFYVVVVKCEGVGWGFNCKLIRLCRLVVCVFVWYWFCICCFERLINKVRFVDIFLKIDIFVEEKWI